MMRLDKYLSHFTGLSRKDVKKRLKAGSVCVDGQCQRDASQHITLDACVTVDGDEIQAHGPRYFMLNKPEGYVSVTKDGEHPTVLDLLDEPRKDKLQIAGRLDIDTTGLLLITDDGQWNHKITSPNKRYGKTYLVELADDLPDNAADLFAKGILLEGEKKPTKPAELTVLFRNEARLTIFEGKYHQVKRMFAAIGNRVTALHREAVGSITLDSTLEPGDYRALTAEEIAG